MIYLAIINQGIRILCISMFVRKVYKDSIQIYNEIKENGS